MYLSSKIHKRKKKKERVEQKEGRGKKEERRKIKHKILILFGINIYLITSQELHIINSIPLSLKTDVHSIFLCL